MTETNPLKILIIGPPRVGKTAIADFLADHAEVPKPVYKPTQGVRIHQFEREISPGSRQGWGASRARISVELWDVSGDEKFRSGWPAIMKDAKAIIMVMNPEAKGQEKDLENWAKNFVGPLKLKDNQVIVFQHQSQQTGGARTKVKLPKILSKIQTVETQIDVSPNVKTEFDSFLSHVFEGESSE